MLIIEQSIKYSRYHKIITFKFRFRTENKKNSAPTRLLLQGQNNVAPFMFTGNYSYIH